MSVLDSITGNFMADPSMTGANPMGTLGAGIMFVFFLIFGGLYVYFSLGYQKIGEKAGLGNSGIAWLPTYGPIAVAFSASKMTWYTFPIIVLGILFSYVLMFSGSAGLAIVAGLLIFGLMVYGFVMLNIWHWKMFEAINKPGFYGILGTTLYIGGLIILGIGTVTSGVIAALGGIMMFGAFVAHAVVIGIGAWSASSPAPVQQQ